jgi:ubiquinone/menaquinone biosynthesis C-methylase UbiE
VRASVGDARDLVQPADSADAVLVLGPLYHLPDACDRARALAEARRVARPGGLVAVAAISRYAALLDLAALGVLDEQTAPLVEKAIETGEHDTRLGFTTAYFHLPAELAAELAEAGLIDVDVLGVEGPSGPGLDAHGLEQIDAFLPSALACARIAERDPALIATSAHFLAFGHA